jgi:hypothetical protein
VQATDEPQVLLAVGREEEASQAMDRLVTEAGDADSPYAEYVRELAVRYDAYLRDRD